MGASKSKSSTEEIIADEDNNNIENQLEDIDGHLNTAPTISRTTSSDTLELPPDCLSLANLQINESDSCMSISGLIKNSLENGRNLNSAVIVAFGESGAGKSSTINKLFNDKNYCKTGQVKSVTTAISIVKKKLVVPHDPSSVAAYLCFVDTPGTFDSYGDDEKYIRLLKQFRTCDPLLNSKQRRFYAGYRKLDDGSNVRITVYPNVVLFFVNADTKIHGNASRIHQSLQVLKETNLVDTKYPNLIVVITRALSFVEEDEDEETENISFRRNYPLFRKAVWRAVEKIFGIKECPVTVVENKPLKQLKKHPGSDYFELPNGELSHHNVLMAIKKCFETRETFSDNLGKLLVGWYLDPECPERNETANVVEYNFTENPDDDETSAMSEIEVKTYLKEKLPQLDEMVEAKNRASDLPKFTFEYLGRGIDRQNGQIKSTNLLGRTDFEEVTIGSKKYNILKGLEVVDKNCVSINSFTFSSLKEMSHASKASHNVQLLLPMIRSLNFNFQGWGSSTEEKQDLTIYCYQMEKSLALFKIDDPEIILKRCPKFDRDLHHLTETEEIEKKFENFFERWGTHCVSEQEVGGAIYIFCTVSSSISKKTQESLDMEFKCLFSNGSVKASTKLGPTIENLRKLGVSNEQIIIKGGTLENFVLDFANLTPEILQQWHDSVAEKPVSIIGEIRCFPDYQLLENNQDKRDMLEHYTASHIMKADSQQLEPLTQQAIANEMTNEAKTESIKVAEEGGCFPPGTFTYVYDARESTFLQKPIEALCQHDMVQTAQVNWSGKNYKEEAFKKLKTATTPHCTYLHKAPNMKLNYIWFSFSNGHNLGVSDNHLVVVVVNGKVHAKRAINVQVGDSAIFLGQSENKQTTELTKCIQISRKIRTGAYAPLTYSGTFFANGFLVTSYADVESFMVAHMSLAPLRMWCCIKNVLNSRDYLSKHEKSSCAVLKRNDDEDKIHPYAKFLMKMYVIGKSTENSSVIPL